MTVVLFGKIIIRYIVCDLINKKNKLKKYIKPHFFTENAKNSHISPNSLKIMSFIDLFL